MAVADLIGIVGEEAGALRLQVDRASGAGFTGELRAVEKQGDVVLVDLARLYEGE